MAAWVSPPIPVARDRSPRGAKLVLHGVDQGGPSFEARVFLDNPAVTITTATDAACGYAGSFHVYGRGDGKPSPTDRELEIGPALQLALAKGGPIVVSVVALLQSAKGPIDLSEHLAIRSASIELR